MTAPDPASPGTPQDAVRPDDPLWRATVEMADHATATAEADENGPDGPPGPSSDRTARPA